MKKFILLLITIFLSLSLFSCEIPTTEEIVLPDLEGLSREEIKEKLDSLGISYIFKFSDMIVEDDNMLDKFVCYNGENAPGKKIKKSYQVYVYTTVLPLTGDVHSTLKMDLDYQGKSFVEDGIGKVTLARSVDGDTAHFYDLNGEYIKVRFLGVDTPESTMEHDPWGKAASRFTANILSNAKTIVLESEGSRTESYGRYLAFVWADGILVNLWLVDEAYSNSTLSSSKYLSYFREAQSIAKPTGRRFYGETDPGYDYDRGDFK